MSNYLDCDFHVCDRERAGVRLEERDFIDAEQRAAKREYIVGHASVFYDSSDPGTEFVLRFFGTKIRERVARTAFDGALKRPDDVRALYNHSDDLLLGRTANGTLDLSIDGKGLRYAFPYDPSDGDHKKVRSKIVRGDLTGSSFGFVVEKESFEDSGDEIIRTIESVNPLVDVSPVTFPAYPSADSSLGRRKQDFVKESLACFIGQNRDNAEVRRLEKRAAKFGIVIPTDIEPGKPIEWYKRRIELLQLEHRIP